MLRGLGDRPSSEAESAHPERRSTWEPRPALVIPDVMRASEHGSDRRLLDRADLMLAGVVRVPLAESWRNRWFVDSALDGDGFEPLVPRQSSARFAATYGERTSSTRRDRGALEVC